MSWTAPKTWTVGEVVTAANMNLQLRDNLLIQFPLGAPAWTSYTPNLTQSGIVTKTVAYAKYTEVGKLVTVAVQLAVTGAGTANNAVTVSLPATAATSGYFVGSGAITDQSAGLTYPGIAGLASTTTGNLLDATAATGGVSLGQTGAAFAAALANLDSVFWFGVYEAA